MTLLGALVVLLNLRRRNLDLLRQTGQKKSTDKRCEQRWQQHTSASLRLRLSM